MMKENGYEVKKVFASPVKHSTQVDKDLYQESLKSFIDELEVFNVQSYKESAINVALDTGNKELFMQLTGN